jgi:hypothetical protein
MKQFSFFSMKRGVMAVVLTLAACLTAMAQDDAISNLINENSDLQVEIINDAVYPWMVTSANEIQCGNVGKQNSSSTLTLTFESTHDTRFDYEWYSYMYSSYYHRVELFIDGEQRKWAENINWGHYRLYLEAGTHVIQFKDSIGNYTYNNPSSLLRNLSIREFDWVDVTVTQAGTLATEVLYNIGQFSGELNDVIQLRVHGPLNSTDWEKIRQMNNLRDIDLTDAQISEVPDGAFRNLSYLQSALLPDGITRIGSEAFMGTGIRSIHIPASVESIGSKAFHQRGNLSEVTFAEGSQLKSINTSAFYKCTSLKEFIMPGTVTSVSPAAFSGCTALQKLYFSDAIEDIESSTCYGCSSLSDLHLPDALVRIWNEAFRDCSSLRHVDFPNTTDNIYYYSFAGCGLDSVCIPVNLRYLGDYAFSYCNNLAYVEMPMYLYDGSISHATYSSYDYNYNNYSRYHGYRSSFYKCPNIRTVVCPSSTPPSIASDLFGEGPAKKNITVKVPKFAVVDYKQHSYWQSFNIEQGEATDYMLITGNLSLNNNRRPDIKSDIDIWNGGSILVGGQAPMPIGQLNIWKGGQILSQCDNISVDDINTIYEVSGSTWYYLTPMYDVDLSKISVSNDALYVFRYYDGAARAQNGKDKANNWKDVGDGVLRAGQGYIFQASKACTLTLPAGADGGSQLFRSGDATIALSTYDTENAANRSWNYVGNPYPTYYDTYRMDFDAPITIRKDNKWVGVRAIDDNVILTPMQSFFVQKPDDMEQIVFHKEGRQLTTEVNRPAGARSSDVSRHLFNLQLSDGEQYDQTRVVINPQASTGYELQCDAAKFMSIGTDSPQLFTLDADGTLYSINERPMADGSVALGFSTPKAAALTLSAARADSEIWLTDHETEQTISLKEQPYTFTVEATAGLCTNRFTLTFSSAPTAIADVNNEPKAGNRYFDLQGRRLNGQPQKGLYIQNGKKYIVK